MDMKANSMRKYQDYVELFHSIFPILVILTFTALLIESFTFKGFIAKHILVSSNTFFMLYVISGIFIVISTSNSYRSNLINRVIANIFIVIYPLLVITHSYIRLLEVSNYPNYVFTKFHIQPENFFRLVVFSSILVVISILIKIRDRSKFKIRVEIQRVYKHLMFGTRHNKKEELIRLISYVICIVFIYYFNKNFNQILTENIRDLAFIFSHRNYSYEEKITHNWGYIYKYISFVKQHTPENASILIPPQKYPWLTIGNGGISKYFLYPRKIVSGNEFGDLENNKDVEYIFIAKGDASADEHNIYGWPKITIKGEKIWYYNADDNSIHEDQSGLYIPNTDWQNKGWGLIKL